jgi:hypothetical protein
MHCFNTLTNVCEIVMLSCGCVSYDERWVSVGISYVNLVVTQMHKDVATLLFSKVVYQGLFRMHITKEKNS